MHIPSSIYIILIHFHTVAAQMVRVESISPQPSCPNQELVYNCQVEFLSLTLRWEHSEFGSLGFSASDDAVGTTKMSSDGRFLANLTVNEGTMPLRMMASTLTIQPPLNDLNGTNLKCGGFELESGDHSSEDVLDLTGE